VSLATDGTGRRAGDGSRNVTGDASGEGAGRGLPPSIAGL
jgi:hypothetical protein